MALLLGRMKGAEPEETIGAVETTVVVEFHIPVLLVYDGIEREADTVVGLSVVVEFHIPVPLVFDGMEREADAVVGLPEIAVDDKVDEPEVLGWLDEDRVEDVVKDEAEVLD